MINFTKRLSVAASFVALCFGQFGAFASNNMENTESSLGRLTSAQATFNHVVKPNKVQIFTLLTCDDKTNLGNLRLVCSEWRNIINELIEKDRKQNLTYAERHPIWKNLMKAAYVGLGKRLGQEESLKSVYEQFLNARLIYRPTTLESDNVILPFLDLKNPFCDTFDLSKCGNSAQKLRFTTSWKDFLQVGGNNELKIVVLFTTRAPIEQRTKQITDPTSALIVNGWAESFGIFWRWGNEKNPKYIDSLTHVSSSKISAGTLYNNWERSMLCECFPMRKEGDEMLKSFQVSFEPENKND